MKQKQSLGTKAVNMIIEKAIGDNAFVNMVANIGNLRDKATAGEYVATTRKTVTELNNVYFGDWVAKRIINKPATDAIRASWYFSELTPDQVKMMESKLKKLKFNKMLLRAVALSRLHGWSYILIGERGVESLSDELLIGADDLTFLTVLKRDQCRPKGNLGYLPAEQTGGEYNEPIYYEFGSYANKKTVHHSRLIRIDCPDPIGGDDGLPMPVLQQVYETVKRLASVNANTGSLIYEAKVDVFRTPRLLETLKTNYGSAVSAMVKRYASIATLKSNNGMIVLDKDEEYINKTYNFSGLPDLMREFSVQTAGAAEMPYSLLFGQSPAGMNSTGDFDMRSYYDSIKTMQENTLREPMERIFQLVADSLGMRVDDFGLIYNTLWQVDEKTRSEIEASNATRDEIYLGLGIVDESMVAQQLKDDGTYTVIDDDHIQLLKSVVRVDEQP